MAHILKMAIVQAIQQLLAAHWSQRRIARELGIDRGTVARYAQAFRSDPNAAISPAGWAESNGFSRDFGDWKCASCLTFAVCAQSP
jgi:transcriptional regulator with XRE-family HTH domain